MTREERWNLRYQEVMAFIETNHRNPSKHRKAMNAGKMRPERVEAFGRLMALMEEYKRKNQYE